MHFWEESGSVLSTQFPSSCCMWQCNPPLSLFSPGWKNSTPSASPCTSYAAAPDYCDDPSLICPCLSCRGDTKTGHSTPDMDLKHWIEWKDHFPRPWWCSPGCGSPSSQPEHTICSCSTCRPSLPSQYQASTVAWGYSTPYSGIAFCFVELQETYLSWNFWKSAVSHKTIDSMAEMSQLASILLHPAADITIILRRGGGGDIRAQSKWEKIARPLWNKDISEKMPGRYTAVGILEARRNIFFLNGQGNWV